MDSITQAALGGAIGGAVLGRSLGRKAIVAGAVLGTLPDMDVVIDYGDAVADFTRHRGFSHSLLILFPLSVILAALLHRWRPSIGFSRWFAMTGLVLLTHPLLDALTTYGTQLFWPFGEPVSIASLFIIDPAYTLPLVAGIAVFLWRPDQHRALALGLCLSTAYAGWSLAAQQLIYQKVQPIIAAHDLTDAPRLIQPMPLSTLLWRTTVVSDTTRLEIVTGFFDPESALDVALYSRDRGLEEQALALDDGRRLDWFTDQIIEWEEREGRLVGTDIRLGVPGHHPFAFIIAERDGNGHWQPMTARRGLDPDVRPDQLTDLWNRLTGAPRSFCLAATAQPPAQRLC